MDFVPYVPIGSRVAATVGATVTAITTAGTRANAILIQNLDASDDARYTLDGSTPSSTVGFILYHSAAGTPTPDPMLLPLGQGQQLKLLRGASADVSVEYQLVQLKNRI